MNWFGRQQLNEFFPACYFFCPLLEARQPWGISLGWALLQAIAAETGIRSKSERRSASWKERKKTAPYPMRRTATDFHLAGTNYVLRLMSEALTLRSANVEMDTRTLTWPPHESHGLI